MPSDSIASEYLKFDFNLMCSFATVSLYVIRTCPRLAFSANARYERDFQHEVINNGEPIPNIFLRLGEGKQTLDARFGPYFQARVERLSSDSNRHSANNVLVFVCWYKSASAVCSLFFLFGISRWRGLFRGLFVVVLWFTLNLQTIPNARSFELIFQSQSVPDGINGRLSINERKSLASQWSTVVEISMREKRVPFRTFIVQ
jgi:hypothetical protein